MIPLPRRRLNALPDLVRALPARQLIHLWLAIFSTFSSIGFVLDVLTGGRQPAALLALNVIVSGLLAVGYAKVAMYTRRSPASSLRLPPRRQDAWRSMPSACS